MMPDSTSWKILKLLMGLPILNISNRRIKMFKPYNRLPGVNSPIPLQKTRPCPLSGSYIKEELFKIEDFQFYEDQDGSNRATHRVVCCPESGLTFTDPAYTDEGLAKLFAKAGMSYKRDASIAQRAAEWVMEKMPDLKYVVDIGCGTGDFLKALPDTVYKYGMDIDDSSVQQAKESCKLGCFVKGATGSLYDLMGVSLVTMFHVLEHVPMPLQELKLLRSLAQPYTKLLIDVPVMELEVTNPCNDLVGFFTVQHLTHFSKTTLGTMLAASGWAVRSAEDMKGYNGYRVLCVPCEPSYSPLNREGLILQRYM